MISVCPVRRGRNPDDARRRDPADAVAHSIFDDRLQAHVRNGGVQGSVVGRNLDAQAILKANLLDGKIQPEIFQLPPERDLLRLDVFEDAAEQVAKPGKHLLGLSPALLAHQHHDGVQGIEQEMRLKLHLEGAQLRPHQLGLQFGGVHFALSKSAVVAEARLDP